MTFSTFNKMIDKALAAMLIFFMALMIFTVVWQVFTRFVINDPSSFTDELSRYLLIWIGILGGAYVYSVKRHLALELLMPKLGLKSQLVLGIFINVLIMIFAYITLVYGGSSFVSTTLQHKQISPGLFIGETHLLIGYVYVVLPLSGVLILYYGLVDIVESVVKIVSKSGDQK